MLLKLGKKEKIQKVLLKSTLIIAGFILGIVGTFLYIQKFGIPFNSVLQNVAEVEEKKISDETIKKVSKLIVLPNDEEPVMATILDVDTLAKEQSFYQGAENGDVVLMYQKALKAIIYSPKKDIIVNVGPVYISDEQAEQDTSLSEIDMEATTTEEEEE